jgi:hypothetical protein
MTGCVRLFQGIDSRVQEIQVFSGGELDVVYRRDSAG